MTEHDAVPVFILLLRACGQPSPVFWTPYLLQCVHTDTERCSPGTVIRKKGGKEHEGISDRQRLHGLCRRKIYAFCQRRGLRRMVQGVLRLTEPQSPETFCATSLKSRCTGWRRQRSSTGSPPIISSALTKMWRSTGITSIRLMPFRMLRKGSWMS